ncbi:unnamed protein product [Allacma fusca]|uniref:Uncharacterized protein n=1 Tax=Allacma fusca TaxID=39272 RepID=A0A8J2KCE3_9HEXA|nr:unnamed protein product [Allacma fusca]
MHKYHTDKECNRPHHHHHHHKHQQQPSQKQKDTDEPEEQGCGSSSKRGGKDGSSSTGNTCLSQHQISCHCACSRGSGSSCQSHDEHDVSISHPDSVMCDLVLANANKSTEGTGSSSSKPINNRSLERKSSGCRKRISNWKTQRGQSEGDLLGIDVDSLDGSEYGRPGSSIPLPPPPPPPSSRKPPMYSQDYSSSGPTPQHLSCTIPPSNSFYCTEPSCCAYDNELMCLCPQPPPCCQVHGCCGNSMGGPPSSMEPGVVMCSGPMQGGMLPSGPMQGGMLPSGTMQGKMLPPGQMQGGMLLPSNQGQGGGMLPPNHQGQQGGMCLSSNQIPPPGMCSGSQGIMSSQGSSQHHHTGILRNSAPCPLSSSSNLQRHSVPSEFYDPNCCECESFYGPPSMGSNNFSLQRTSRRMVCGSPRVITSFDAHGASSCSQSVCYSQPFYPALPPPKISSSRRGPGWTEL